jgi:hypothetical protein
MSAFGRLGRGVRAVMPCRDWREPPIRRFDDRVPTVNAFAAVSPTAPLQLITIERREVGPRDVQIDIQYTGICHSDIHEVRGDWGDCPYPLAPGHEITGVVSAVGAEVTRFTVGDRVGVGCLVGSCGKCDACVRGQEQYCSVKAIWTYGDTDVDGTVTQGGYSTQIATAPAARPGRGWTAVGRRGGGCRRGWPRAARPPARRGASPVPQP